MKLNIFKKLKEGDFCPPEQDDSRDLLYFISHKLSSELTKIKWGIEELSSSQMDDQRRDFLSSKIKEAVNSSISVLNDSMNNGSFVSGGKVKCDMKKGDINLSEIIKEVVMSEEISKKRQGVSINLVGFDSPIILDGDRENIKFVFSGIIGNAIKYSQHGSTVYVEGKVEDGGVRVFVKDTGLGIPEEDKEKIFSKHFRGSNTSGVDGHGFGLYFCKKIIFEHCGNIKFYPNQEKGTVFEIFLPKR